MAGRAYEEAEKPSAKAFPGCLKRVHARLRRAMAARRTSRRDALLIRGPHFAGGSGYAGHRQEALHRVRDTVHFVARMSEAISGILMSRMSLRSCGLQAALLPQRPCPLPD